MLRHIDMNARNNNLLEWCIRVDSQDNPQFNCRDIGKLFQGCVGAVIDATEYSENGRKWIKVTFGGEDELKKALCMSGYTIGDTNIQVTSLSSRHYHPFPKLKSKHSFKSKRESDSRRNLYVLNLPHDLSVQAYRDLFTAHGTPTHTVLLKTQDSCSRRRGFVVMSTHEEAQNVIRWLDGICIRGFQLRVTWANIDRSNGFMSGYDRTTFLGQNSNLSSDRPASEPTCLEQKSPRINMDTSTVVASNIPISLFPDHEIDSLFKPFGPVKVIQLIPPNPSSEGPLSTLASASPVAQTAIVTYEKADDAIAAKNTLHGQVYEGFTLAVGFVSKLGTEDLHAVGTPSAPRSLTPKLSPLVHNSAPFSAFGHAPLLPASLPFEETFRGLPAALDFYDIPVQLQHRNGFSLRHSSQSHWTDYSTSLPHTQSHQTFPVLPQYEPSPAARLHYQHSNGSHSAHHPNISGMHWG